MKKSILILLVSVALCAVIVSALGYNNPNLPKLVSDRMSQQVVASAQEFFRIAQNTTTIGNTGPQETQIIVYDIAANTLNSNGDTLEGLFEGNITNGAGSTQVKIYYFNGTDQTTIYDSTEVAVAPNGAFTLEYDIIRENSTTIRTGTRLTTSVDSTMTYTSNTVVFYQNFGATNKINITAKSTDGGDASNLILHLFSYVNFQEGA